MFSVGPMHACSSHEIHKFKTEEYEMWLVSNFSIYLDT